MESAIVALSSELAKLVQEFSSYVVAVHGRRQYPSSGVFWRPNLVVTADHTIRKDEDIQVTLADGTTAQASLVGRDSGADLALLRVLASGPEAASAQRNDLVQVGELALVLGRSPDSGPNASLGVISAVSGPWKTWRGGRLDQYIRLDATLYPNSSGGAVINSKRKIVGIATSALSRIAGLAIPASTIDRVVDKLLEKGYMPRGYLGVGVQPVSIPAELRSKLSLANETGVMVLSVEPGSPAEKAGVLLGDVVVGLGNVIVEGIEDLQSFWDSGVIGTTISVKLVRAGAQKELSLVVGERPRRQAQA